MCTLAYIILCFDLDKSRWNNEIFTYIFTDISLLINSYATVIFLRNTLSKLPIDFVPFEGLYYRILYHEFLVQYNAFCTI